MIKLAWNDTSDPADVTVYDAKAEFGGQEARVYCYTRYGSHPWTAEAGGGTSTHRKRELAEAAAERRLRAAAHGGGARC
ncbi:hypothetical protein WMF38_57295 [Sorangium sp. So ce118]